MTRQDLVPGLQAAQVAHAAFAFAYEHRPIATQWLEESNYLIVLSVPNEAALHELAERADGLRLPVTVFREPDLDNELTAIAVAPCRATESMLSQLPLALREVALT